MKDINVTNSIKYIGVDDKTLDLFESQYPLPNGVSYNSYVILDEKVVVMDTVDSRSTDEWFNNLERVLNGRTIDYLVISHLEPDHSANIKNLIEKYPNMRVVGNAKTFSMLPQFFDVDLANKSVVVKEEDELNLGSHTLKFFMAPMVHWPEVMVTYEKSEKILFTADAFGKFGTLDIDDEWTAEARRYYFNIVGKYGSAVQVLLKKAAKLDIEAICSLHGPILKENISYYLDKYNTWSSYEPESDGVLIAYASIHGNTANAAKKMASILESKGAKNIVLFDLSRGDVSKAVMNAFTYDKLILAAASYDGGVFPCMEEFLLHLKSKNYQKRTVGVIENGSWAPMAAKCMKDILEKMRNITICDPMVSIRSVAKDKDIETMEELAEKILK